MVGSIFLGSWRESDSGLLNMSCLDTYLGNLLKEYQMEVPEAASQFPALYRDGIFPQRFRDSDENHRRINTRMSTVKTKSRTFVWTS